jgi:hypothetical protein
MRNTAMKRLPARRSLVEWVLSAGALLTLIGAITAIDGHARAYVAGVVASPYSSAHDARMPHAVRSLAQTAWDLCLDHQPLAFFACAATVLVVFMLRTR